MLILQLNVTVLGGSLIGRIEGRLPYSLWGAETESKDPVTPGQLVDGELEKVGRLVNFRPFIFPERGQVGSSLEGAPLFIFLFL